MICSFPIWEQTLALYAWLSLIGFFLLFVFLFFCLFLFLSLYVPLINC